MRVKNIFCYSLLICFAIGSAAAYGQRPGKDSLLQEVVVTGQYAPQSLRQSVFRVRTITREQIRQRAATDVLGTLNPMTGIRFSPDAILGETDSVQYARLGETTIKTLAVAKNASYNFVFASLETDKAVGFEPAKTAWDIEWSYSTYNSGLGSPYWFQDFVLLNYAGGARAAQVLTATVSYANFAESNLSSVTWLSTRDAIGSSWRSTTGTGIYRDRFYVVKDPRGNVYKLQFVSMGVGSDGGERGRPIIQYSLVKKG